MDMNSPEARQLLKEVQLGINTLRFLETDLGGALTERCIADRSSSLEELADADPFDRREICRLQMEIQVPTRIMQYLDDVVQRGEQAERILTGPAE